jgi:hypothetical protein
VAYMNYRQFIACKKLERATVCQALEAPQVSRDTRTASIRDYGVCAPLPSILLSSVNTEMGALGQGLVSQCSPHVGRH